MIFSLFFFTAISIQISSTNFASISSDIKSYFDSETVRAFKSQWFKYKTAIENAALLELKENFGHKSMNVYVRRTRYPILISNGYFLSDNIVDVLILNLRMREIPYMYMDKVELNLVKNVVQVRSGLSKMFIDSHYLLFRNQTSILYGGKPKDLYQSSPFTFQEIQDSGELTIMVENCILEGFSIATLDGATVNLGHDAFNLVNCDFNIEISSPGFGTPPVIAPYFPEADCKNLQTLLMKPISSELMPKLQGIVTTLLNTTSIFNTSLHKYIHSQENIYKKTGKYMTDLVHDMNKRTIKRNQGSVELDDLRVQMDTMDGGKLSWTAFKLKNMVLSGLDTAYSSRSGGPYKPNQHPLIAERIGFNVMQVHGQLNYENETNKAQYDFAAEIHDVDVHVIVGDILKNKNRITVIGWRKMEFSTMKADLFLKERIAAHSLITGYLINEIPAKLSTHLKKVFGAALPATGESEKSERSEEEKSTFDEGNNSVEKEEGSNMDKNEGHVSGTNADKNRNYNTKVSSIPQNDDQLFSKENDPMFSEGDKNDGKFFSTEVLTDNSKENHTVQSAKSENIKGGGDKADSNTEETNINSEQNSNYENNAEKSNISSEKKFNDDIKIRDNSTVVSSSSDMENGKNKLTVPSSKKSHSDKPPASGSKDSKADAPPVDSGEDKTTDSLTDTSSIDEQTEGPFGLRDEVTPFFNSRSDDYNFFDAGIFSDTRSDKTSKGVIRRTKSKKIKHSTNKNNKKNAKKGKLYVIKGKTPKNRASNMHSKSLSHAKLHIKNIHRSQSDKGKIRIPVLKNKNILKNKAINLTENEIR